MFQNKRQLLTNHFLDIPLLAPQPGEPLFAGEVWTDAAFSAKPETVPEYQQLANQVVRWTTQSKGGIAAQIIYDSVLVAGDLLYPRTEFQQDPTIQPSTHPDTTADPTDPTNSTAHPPEEEWELMLRFAAHLEKHQPTDLENQHAQTDPKKLEIKTSANGLKGSISLLANRISCVLQGLYILRSWYSLSLIKKRPTREDLGKYAQYNEFDWWPLLGFVQCGVRGLLIVPGGSGRSGSGKANVLAMIKMTRKLMEMEEGHKIFEAFFKSTSTLIMDHILQSGLNSSDGKMKVIFSPIDKIKLAKCVAFDFGKCWMAHNPGMDKIILPKANNNEEAIQIENPRRLIDATEESSPRFMELGSITSIDPKNLLHR